jgi:hypothetical protein
MSHIRTDTTTVRDPDVNLLRTVAQHIAGTEPGGRVAATALDYNGYPQASDIDLALFTTSLRRGVAIDANVKDKEGHRTLAFTGDPYMVTSEYNRITGRVSGEYIDAMLVRGFGTANYVVTDSVPDDRGGRTLTFLGTDATKVFVKRDEKGRLEWNFEGFSGQSCYDVQKVIADFLRANGVVTETVSVTDKRDERWEEERIPSRDRERE